MARTRFRNPIGFLPTPVTFIVVITYVAIAAGLLYVHHVVSPAPKKDSPVIGVNVTEALERLANPLKRLPSIQQPQER